MAHLTERTDLDDHRAHLPADLDQIAEVVFDTEARVSADHASPLANRLRGMGFDIPRIWAAPRWNMGATRASRRRHTDPDDPRIQRAAELLEQVVETPCGPALLGLYLWSIAEDASQQSARHGRVAAALTGLRRAWITNRERVPCRHCRSEADAVVALGDAFRARLDVAAARNSGNVERLVVMLDRAVQSSARLEETARRITDETSCLRGHLVHQARIRLGYFTAIGEAAIATRATLGGDPSGLTDAIAQLRDLEKAPGLNYILASELRAHRAHLEALAAGVGSDWLTVDRCRTVYVFPFGLPQVDGAEATERIRGLVGSSLPDLLGTRAVSVRTALKLDDVWDTEDPFGAFDGATLNLPDVSVTQPDGTPVAHLSCEVRFGDLGNHYVRFRQTAKHLGPQDVRDARYLVSSLHDDLRMHWDIPQPDGTVANASIVDSSGYHPVHLFHLAYRLQEAIAAHFAGRPEGWRTPAKPDNPGPALSKNLARGRSHVLTFVVEASAGRGPACPPEDRRPVTSADELLATYGHQPLLQPVPYNTTSLADWTLAQRQPVLLEGVRNSGDLVAVTPNATTIAMFDTAHFKIVQYGSLVEFVASISGMLAAWNTRLAQYFDEVEDMLGRPGTADTEETDLAARTAYLSRQQLQLHRFAGRARRAMSVVSSPTLLASATEYQQMAELLRAFDLTRQSRELDRRLRELLAEPIAARLATVRRQHEELEAEEQRRMLEGLTVAVSTFAVLTVFHTILAIAVEANDWSGWVPVTLAIISSVVAFVLAVLLFVVWVRRLRLRHRRPSLLLPGFRVGR
ncbi:hypothetical protein [Myceligenerans xiligouense]|uniref:CorA-like Mg2+ transporter protein n=1 Tax=Myceligenerans xiligouense TaxID=253184 RepID=A0A3N4YPS0_9MICO|nr:hypothetical protein [Myceligenerans xiligouense]RPF22127.1 hypothetical protein EDD34_2774 [Myceligenerans xiligouense]